MWELDQKAPKSGVMATEWPQQLLMEQQFDAWPFRVGAAGTVKLTLAASSQGSFSQVD